MRATGFRKRLEALARLVERHGEGAPQPPSPPILTAVSIVIANSVPLAGVLFLHWNVLLVLFMYWFETLVIVMFNIPKMMLGQGTLGPDDPRWSSYGGMAECEPGTEISTFAWISGLGLGISAVVLITMLGNAPEYERLRQLTTEDLAGLSGGGWPILLGFLGFLASEMISFIGVFLRDGQFRHISAREQMDEPIGRVLGMWCFVWGAGCLGIYIGGLRPLLAAGIVVNTALELRALRKGNSQGTG